MTPNLEDNLEYDINYLLNNWYSNRIVKKLIKKILSEYWEVEIYYINIDNTKFNNLNSIDYDNHIIVLNNESDLKFLDSNIVLDCYIKDPNYNNTHVIIRPYEWKVNIRLALDINPLYDKFLFFKVSKIFHLFYESLNPDIISVWEVTLPTSLTELKNNNWVWECIYIRNMYLSPWEWYQKFEYLDLNKGKLFFINDNIEVLSNKIL